MDALIIGLVVVVGLFILFKVKSGFSKYKAAMNALLAKYTFEALDSESRAKVVARTQEILSAGGISNAANRVERLEEKERLGFYALAMAELGIPPALSGYDWQFVRNPFLALLNAESQIHMAKSRLQKSQGIEIDV